MGKRLSFSTISFGSDGSLPDTGTLAGWLSRRRGRETDIISFLLDQELSCQTDAGVTRPCAGGRFYSERWQEAISGIAGGLDGGDEGSELVDIRRDAEEIAGIARNAWLAAPAPHLVSLGDQIFRDSDEKEQDLFMLYRTLMRTGRDAFIEGHILIGDRPVREDEMFGADPYEVYYSVGWMKRYTEVFAGNVVPSSLRSDSTVVLRAGFWRSAWLFSGSTNRLESFMPTSWRAG